MIESWHTERLDRLAAMGITAVSIGAQSFHDEVLRELRRPHDAAASRAAVKNALGRFACVDVDLIVDVAWEDQDVFPGAFLEDVRACLELRQPLRCRQLCRRRRAWLAAGRPVAAPGPVGRRCVRCLLAGLRRRSRLG